MQWSARTGPALRLSDFPWECQMWGHPSTQGSDQAPPFKVIFRCVVNAACCTLRKQHIHTRSYVSKKILILHLCSFHQHSVIKTQQHKFKKNLFVGDSSWPLQRGLPTQQLSFNEGEVMSVRLRRIVMPNVHPGCYSEPLLSEVLAHFWLHKTRGVDHPKRNLVAFPFEYKSHLTPDNSKRWKIFQQTASQGLRIVEFYFCAESIRRMSWMEDST